MNGKVEQLVFGVCVALLVLGVFVGAGALARALAGEEADADAGMIVALMRVGAGVGASQDAGICA